jgi:hypothetical protein
LSSLRLFIKLYWNISSSNKVKRPQKATKIWFPLSFISCNKRFTWLSSFHKFNFVFMKGFFLGITSKFPLKGFVSLCWLIHCGGDWLAAGGQHLGLFILSGLVVYNWR